ncbi:MAG: PmoA family protein [Pirellulales bacterium]|nr:PmoA family protein [Pirellulales bacterium]
MHLRGTGVPWLLGAAMLAATPAGGNSAEFKVEPHQLGAIVSIDGQRLATYRTNSGHQPIIWPIIGPGGEAMTRQYPMGEALAGEPDDHPHHRSLWFNHGDVGGKDFWMEPRPEGPPERNNQIEHRQFSELASGETGRLVARNDWTSGGKKVCEDVRTIEFSADEHGRWIDFAVEVHASEGDVTFGDTKEGSFGLRVPGTMAVDAQQGGQIRNSAGQTDEAAWGRQADWVDYHGPVEGKPAGIAIFDMPDSFRHPTKWHVRTYGLFAANPFGQQDFPPEGAKQGAHTIKKGEKLRLHYRVLFYSGEKTAEELAAIYAKLTAGAEVKADE